jgi:hypothetical protein
MMKSAKGVVVVNKIRWLLAAMCMGLLTACGGGGGGEPDKREDPALPANYMVALSASTSNDSGAQLDIVDPNTAERLRSVSIDSEDAWLTTLSRSQSADGRSLTMQHEAALYYIDDKRVRAVDLTRGNATQSRQVSSLTDACRILWHVDSDLTGKDSWLAVVRAGNNGQCETSGDDQYALVHSSTAATESANAGPFSLADLVISGRNAAGQLNRLITFERSLGSLVQWVPNNGLAASAVVNGSGIPANADVRWLGWLPGFQDRGIVQVGGALRMLSWTDAGSTLSAIQASNVVPYGPPFVTADANRLYVVAGQTSQVILAFDSTGNVTQVATLDAAKGAATELMASADALWVVQKDEASLTAPSTLTAIAKATGVAREADRYEVLNGLPSDLGLMLVGVNGSRLVYSRPSDQDDDEAVAFHVIDHASATPQALVARAQGMGVQLAATALVGQARATTQLFWCDMGTPAVPVDCSATRFKGYNLATGAVTSLGPQVPNADASAAVDFAFIGSPHGLSSLVSTLREEDIGASASTMTTRLWQFKPDMAHSLTFVARDSGTYTWSGNGGGSGSTSSGSVTSTLTFVTGE